MRTGEYKRLMDKSAEEIALKFSVNLFNWLSAEILLVVETIEIKRTETPVGPVCEIILTRKDGKISRYALPYAVYSNAELKTIFEAFPGDVVSDLLSRTKTSD